VYVSEGKICMFDIERYYIIIERVYYHDLVGLLIVISLWKSQVR
jgi:hypothetical protein